MNLNVTMINLSTLSPNQSFDGQTYPSLPISSAALAASARLLALLGVG